MKFTSIFFAASAAIFLTCHKGTQFFGNQYTAWGYFSALHIYRAHK